MTPRKLPPIGLLFLIPVLGVLVLGALFFLRPPVVLAGDSFFDSLYGGRRGLESRIRASVRLFRPVRVVQIADAAGPDVVAFAVEEAASQPYCVVFPYRYSEGAKRYARDHPQTPALVLEGRRREPLLEPSPVYIGTDQITDLYRAGRCAAVFAGAAGRVLVYQDEPTDSPGREALSRGLQDGGHEGVPLYLNAGADYTAFEGVSCVVMMGSPAFFLERALDIPVILFSWIDPALTSSRVKVVFDDSPWAQLVPAVKMLDNPLEETLIPSKISPLMPRIKGKEILRTLKGLRDVQAPPQGTAGGNPGGTFVLPPCGFDKALARKYNQIDLFSKGQKKEYGDETG
jgi:hypothetical protein